MLLSRRADVPFWGYEEHTHGSVEERQLLGCRPLLRGFRDDHRGHHESLLAFERRGG